MPTLTDPASFELIESLESLRTIPGVGKSIAYDLYKLGIRKPSDLRGKDPQELFDRSNFLVGTTQDRCLLYVFRCAVYFAETNKPDRKKLQWWYWKDKK
ncbi:MAG TPA: helix-hairpin-helix domain-containing protein [Puia sp.]|nr:helix-hairpin-helix domain-containing protein [Puia sp.]